MIIVEGMDGVGKTTLVDYLVTQDMSKHHFDYDSKNLDLMTKYMKLLENETDDLVLDRSFISEMVYGPVLRGASKLQLIDYKELLLAYQSVGLFIIYLTAPKNELLKRRKNDCSDYSNLAKYYDDLNRQYDFIMSYTQQFVDVHKFDTKEVSETEVQQSVKKLVLK